LQLKFSISSDINAIAPAVDKLIDAIRAAGCLPDNFSDLEIAAFEALANAVIHGNRQDADKQVHITCRCQCGEDVAIIVRDEGPGFDPQRVPDPTRPENLESEHGRGILLMKTFMDDVRYEAGGTEVHMRKKVEVR
jgi:serine/threonine-protein kinase RsbW